jgi:hypothetical protein
MNRRSFFALLGLGPLAAKAKPQGITFRNGAFVATSPGPGAYMGMPANGMFTPPSPYGVFSPRLAYTRQKDGAQ